MSHAESKGEEVSVPLVKEILEHRFTSGPDMKAVLCMFDTLLESYKCKGLYRLGVSVQKWMGNMDKVNVKSSQGLVYFSDIKGIQIVIKIPKNERQYSDLIREYFIGVTAVNNLRYKVPNFMYTMGAFIYPPEDNSCPAFVACEKIPGITLEKAIRDAKITFEEFLNIYIQILLALEVAQRSCSFCHYDLHINNVILRTLDKPYCYTVVLNDQRYDVTVKKYLPVIIDFGITSVKYDDRTIGSYQYHSYGMEHYPIQGADMYKLLFYSYIYASGNMQRQIGNLFLFYGQYDPYKVLVSSNEDLKSYTKEYLKKIAISHVASYTPFDFVTWLLREQPVTSVQPRERNIYTPISYESSAEIYASIFQENGRLEALRVAENCADTPNSYIMLKYLKRILEKYSSKHMSQKLQEKIRKNKVQLIQTDKTILKMYNTITCPNEFQVRDCVNQIVSTTIPQAENAGEAIERFTNTLEFVSQISPYLQYLYTIREMKLEKIYSQFVDEFTTSRQYNMYTQLISSMERARRWSSTLIKSLPLKRNGNI